MRYALKYDEKKQILNITDTCDGKEYSLVGLRAYFLYTKVIGVGNYSGLSKESFTAIVERAISKELTKI